VGQSEGMTIRGRPRRIWDSNMERILKWWFGREWIESIWFSIGIRSRSFCTPQYIFGFLKMLGISWLRNYQLLNKVSSVQLVTRQTNFPCY